MKESIELSSIDLCRLLYGNHDKNLKTLRECFEDAGYKIKDIYFQSFGLPARGAEFIDVLKEGLADINEEELKASEIVIIAERD